MPLIDSLDSPAVQALNIAQATFKIFQHASKIESLQQAAAERGQNPDQIIRSILFRLSNGQFILVLASGEMRISWKALRAYLGERRLSLASPREVREQTGYEIGAVTPFGLARPMRILADPAIFAYPEISIGAGLKGYALILPSGRLRTQLKNLEIISLGE